MENRIVSFSSKFSEPTLLNSQFSKVKIYVAYAGKNRNYSYISKETFEKMIPTLYGVPIVGEYKESKEDFGSHGGKLEISDDGLKYIETTKPYGFIDSSANVSWEEVEEENGEKRDYLVVDGYLWTGRYPEAITALEGNNNQSMEINVSSYQQLQEDEQYFEILDAEFSALCVLGTDVEPCFESSSLSAFSLDKDKFKEEFSLMVSELKKSFNVEEVEVDLESETEIVEEFAQESEVAEVEEEAFENTIEEEQLTQKFSLTANQKRELLGQALPNESNDDVSVYTWVMDFNDEYVMYSEDVYSDDGYSYKYYRAPYIITDGVATVNTSAKEEIVQTWVTVSELEAMQSESQARFTELETKVLEITTKYDEVTKELNEIYSAEKLERLEEIYSEFDEQLSDVEGYSELKEKALEMEVEEFEEKCVFMLGMKNRSKTTKAKPKQKVFSAVAVNIEKTSDEKSDKKAKAIEKYGDAGKYLIK